MIRKLLKRRQLLRGKWWNDVRAFDWRVAEVMGDRALILTIRGCQIFGDWHAGPISPRRLVRLKKKMLKKYLKSI